MVAKWQANEELVRKHFAIEITGDDENRNVAGIYIWAPIEAAMIMRRWMLRNIVESDYRILSMCCGTAICFRLSRRPRAIDAVRE